MTRSAPSILQYTLTVMGLAICWLTSEAGAQQWQLMVEPRRSIPGEHLQVPQVAFEDSCPKRLDFYVAQLENPDRPPVYLSQRVADVIALHGTSDAALKALRDEIAGLREDMKSVLKTRSIRDLDSRARADELLSSYTDRLLAAQAMLAAVTCRKAEEAAPRRSRR